VSWDKLQWLVAALSVGLGFGMQEIFANFISGIMILFERPVRIGDTITIGNLSGTVSKIRIRATTITDFDRKDIIVPNKTFITGQLINWSLTDTVTRVTLKLGIDYGSDLDLVRNCCSRPRGKTRGAQGPGADRVLPQLRRKPRPRTAHARARPGRPQPDAGRVNRFINREFKKHTSTSRSGRWRCTSRTKRQQQCRGIQAGRKPDTGPDQAATMRWHGRAENPPTSQLD
jgi:potassium efflux system protein